MVWVRLPEKNLSIAKFVKNVIFMTRTSRQSLGSIFDCPYLRPYGIDSTKFFGFVLRQQNTILTKSEKFVKNANFLRFVSHSSDSSTFFDILLRMMAWIILWKNLPKAKMVKIYQIFGPKCKVEIWLTHLRPYDYFFRFITKNDDLNASYAPRQHSSVKVAPCDRDFRHKNIYLQSIVRVKPLNIPL